MNRDERSEEDEVIADILRGHVHPIGRDLSDFDPLLEQIGDARVVLIGEASHGTHEFYYTRAEITKRLIAEKGFTVIAVEADWPDAYRINQFVRGRGNDRTPSEALGDFERFPLWMWRNEDVVEFLGWLREYNSALPPKQPRVGFYGMDLYSLYQSVGAVIAYLDKADPDAAKRARYRYGCFDHYGENSQAYGYAASFGIDEPCEEEVLQHLRELTEQAGNYRHDGAETSDEHFYAEQNARLVKNAEQYYRSMFGGRMLSWNVRDEHMAETIGALLDYFDRDGTLTKAVVWPHNSHLGDARQTEMGRRGELNVGQLIRERYKDEAFAIGFSTYSGTVTAATDWDNPPRQRQVRPALEGSYEHLLHQVGIPAFLLSFHTDSEATEALDTPRLERAIGVIYRPESERLSHYFLARLPKQFDAVIHFDRSRALVPLEREGGWESAEEVPETYPFGV